MTEPVHYVTERISTVDDGPGTVNERLSTGGPGPEGQEDTVTEKLSGNAAPAKSSLKPEWVDHAVRQGASRADAEAATKEDLVKRYGD